MERASFEARRLTLARWAAGMTKRELADRLGLSPASITQYEAGNTVPRGETIATMALQLGVPAAYFESADDRRKPLGECRSFFRSLRSTRQWERDQADARAEHVYDLVYYLERQLNLPAVEVPELVPSSLEAPRNEVECLAGEVRAAWQVEPGPIGHVVRLLEKHGIVVARLGSLTNRLDAFSRWFEVRPVVILWDGKGDKGRSRFDAAHELAHLVMHHEPELGRQAQERQAHAFAAAFLMPAEVIEPELPRRVPRGASEWEQLFALRKRWGVSVAAILYRSRELNALTDASFRRSMVKLNERGIRHSDGAVLGDPERPMLLQRAVEEVLRFRKTDLDGLGRELRFSRRQLDEILGQCDPMLGEVVIGRPSPMCITAKDDGRLRAVPDR